MAAGDMVPVPGGSFEQAMMAQAPDLVREMIRAFAQKMTGAGAGTACGAGYGEVSPNRVNSPSGSPARHPCGRSTPKWCRP